MKESLITLLQKVNQSQNLLDDKILIDLYVDKLIDKSIIITHYESKKLIAFCAFYANDISNKLSYLTMICVDPEWQGKGIGRALIEYWVSFVKKNNFIECRLAVKKDNIKAINLYSKQQFISVADKGGSIIMSKLIKNNE